MDNKTKKVLLIDDDRTFIALIQGVLRKNGYEVMVAANGQEGLECIEENMPDLILLDVLMPEMTGYEFVQNIRKHKEALKQVPIIVISSRKSMKDFFNMWELSFFIEKPFQPQELLSKIEYALDSVKTEEESESMRGLLGRGKKALVVGHENSMIMTLEGFLLGEDFEVRCANREVEGMVEVVNFMPDVVVAQYHHVRGIINVRRLRDDLLSRETTKEIPIVVVSPLGMESSCLDDFEKKQIIIHRNPEELRRKLEKVLSYPLENLL